MRFVLNRPALEGLMQKENLNQNELARKLGVDPSYICRLFKGERRPGVKILYALRRVYAQYPLDFFIVAVEDADSSEKAHGWKTSA